MRLIVRRIVLYAVTAIVAITINFFPPGSCRGTRRSRCSARRNRPLRCDAGDAVAAADGQDGKQRRAGGRARGEGLAGVTGRRLARRVDAQPVDRHGLTVRRRIVERRRDLQPRMGRAAWGQEDRHLGECPGPG
jgi:hypothetical protein